jgi:two-component system, NtrC family, response regulator PilR
MSKPTVLVVDDEPDLVELVSLTLNRMNLDTQSAGDVAVGKPHVGEAEVVLFGGQLGAG